jgi:GT2 family glycosyltransferase
MPKKTQGQKLPKTLNIGFKVACGKYLTWISDDNYFAPNALEVMNDALDKMKHVGLVYTDYTCIDDRGKIGKRIYQEPPEYLPIRDCVGACFMYRASVAKKVGEYNKDMVLVEDYDYWLRLGLVTKLYHIPASFYFYRVHDGALTKTRKEEIRMAKNALKNIYFGKYSIPDIIHPISDLYSWYIEDKDSMSYFKLLKIILSNPIITTTYILKNLRRL